MRIHSFITAFAVTAIVFAQSPVEDGIEPAQGGWLHFGHNGDVRALCRVGDSLWVGTGGGLFIYDLGSNEFAVHLAVGEKLPSNSVRAIAAKGDTVYVGTDDGLAVFSRDAVNVFTGGRPGRFVGAPFERIHQIDFGLDDVIYLSTYGSGLGVLDGDTAWVITREDSLLDDKVYGMVQEDDTTFYFATSMGLCAYRDSVWVNFQAGAGIPRAEIREIVIAPDGGYYLLVDGRGVYWFDGERARRITNPSLFPENAVASIAVDARGDLWACGDHGVIAVYRNRHWTRIDEQGEAAVPGGRRWRCAHADSLGGVYFGSSDGLVLTIQDEIVDKFRLPTELPSGGVEAMATDSSGTLYVLNGSYLVSVARGLETITIEHPSPIVVAMTVSPPGELWTATRWGIYRREGERYVEFPSRLSERNPIFSSIGFDASGSLWVGTQAGKVHRFDGEVWMRMADAGELAPGAIRDFDVDGRDRLWVTGSAGGASAYHGGRWTSFGPAAFGGEPARTLVVAPNGTPVLATANGVWGFGATDVWMPVEFDNEFTDNELGDAGGVWDPTAPPILSLGFDPSGRLYVGTERGLAVVDETGTRWWTYRDGLGGTSVSNIFTDEQDNVWIGFRSDGLTRIPQDALR
jgi:ligand-binding sensor domain-containing protein